MADSTISALSSASALDGTEVFPLYSSGTKKTTVSAIYTYLNGQAIAYGNSSFLFGTGSDGTVTLDGVSSVDWATLSAGVYTMTRDVMAVNLTVDGGVELVTAGYQIFCSDTFTNNGIVGNKGTKAVSQFTAGLGAAGSVYGAGGNGANTNGAIATTNSIGGDSGLGGRSATHNPNGYGIKTATPPIANEGGEEVLSFLLTAYGGASWSGTSGTRITGGAGANGGAGTAGHLDQSGGGGGGGVVGVFARTFAGNGSGIVTAQGGQGYQTQHSDTGGGGGGGGGGVFIVTRSPNWAGFMTATAAGGLGGSTVPNGGYPGMDGEAGRVVVFIV